MDTDARCVALVNGAPIPAIPLRTVPSPSPDMAIKHWRDRALTAERYAQELEKTLQDTIEEMDRYLRDLSGIQADVQKPEAYCAELVDQNDRLRSDRWFRRTIVGLATLLLGYAVGVLMR